MTREELDWKQYDMMALTIRWGIELLLKANVFYYAVTGAILSFYLSRPAPQPSTLKFALVVPALLALVLAVIFLLSASTMWKAETQIQTIAGNLKLTAWPDTVGLKWALIGSAVLLLLVALALVLVMAFESCLGIRRS